jgi:hypothetical protein
MLNLAIGGFYLYVLLTVVNSLCFLAGGLLGVGVHSLGVFPGSLVSQTIQEILSLTTSILYVFFAPLRRFRGLV